MGVVFEPNLSPFQTPYRSLSVKLDNLQMSGIKTSGSTGGASDQALASLESRLVHQLSEMQAAVAKNVQSGGSGPLTASEQMQPIYDLKAKIQELQTQLLSLQRTVQVRRERGEARGREGEREREIDRQRQKRKTEMERGRVKEREQEIERQGERRKEKQTE